MTPPKAKKQPVTLTYHNQPFSDDYYWMRQRDNQDVIDYLTAENNYTNAVMQDTEQLQQQLFDEIKARIQEEDQSVPVFEDGYYYYTRTEEGKEYAIHCRKKGSLTAEEEILLDENKLAEGENYFQLGEFAVSPNNQFLAYSIDTEGNEAFTIFILDLQTGQLNEYLVKDTYYSLEWTNDNKAIYYTKFDEAHRPYQLWRHQVNQDASTDELVFEEEDASYFLEISKSKDNEYFFLQLGSQITSEVWMKQAHTIEGDFALIEPRAVGVEYDVDHYKGKLFILTNADGAINFKLMQTSINQPNKEHWQEVFAYNAKHYLQGLECFEHNFVLEERVNGQQQIRVFTTDFKNEKIITFKDKAYSVRLGDNPEYTTNLLRLHYRSLVTPNTTYDYNMESGELIERKVQTIPSGYQAKNYTTERLYATADDGAEIPISLVYKKGLSNGPKPLYLYAYGSYGVNIDPFFSIAQLSLLNRGFVFAIANIRGGSEKGRDWYENGKFLNKRNTFTDFITSAKHLINEGYTQPELLVANGGSAGGLLMGAVANMAPDLFHTIVADVPFVDVMNTMMDETIPLTVIEYDEWGNPNDKQYFDYMLSYSPYNNVEPKNYPNLLVTAGLNDPRVQYWEPAKWVAKLRELKTDDNLLLLKTNMDAGHSGASGRFNRIKETAFEYAFILKTLNQLNEKS